jgi:hypothetical protein
MGKSMKKSSVNGGLGLGNAGKILCKWRFFCWENP